jgi:hypothetical protein
MILLSLKEAAILLASNKLISTYQFLANVFNIIFLPASGSCNCETDDEREISSADPLLNKVTGREKLDKRDKVIRQRDQVHEAVYSSQRSLDIAL